MSDRPEESDEPPPDLDAAVRRARVERAEQGQAISDLRQTEIARLSLLEGAIRPVLDQTPPDVDIFDLGLSQGERPRLFLDMVSFIEMAHDRRVYRFYQDTRYGRVLIAESARVDRIVSAVTNYVARRLVERERYLVSEWRGDEAREGGEAPDEARGADTPPAGAAEPAEARAAAPPPRRAQGRRPPRPKSTLFVDVATFVLMTLGSITLILIIIASAYLAWARWLHG